jgi:clan AA aspartic protease
MGLTHVTVRVSPLTSSKRGFQGEFLVDTGALDCLAPASALRKAGVKVEGRDVYELADGQTAEYSYGHVRVSFLGSSTVSRIIFGPEDVEPILGVVALESTGIAVDPVSKTLKRMAAKPLKAARRGAPTP